MDRDGPGGQPDGIIDYHDVDVDVWNIAGQFVGTYEMEDISDYAGNPYSNRYPDIIKPYDQITCTPPGKAYASYTLLPHYQWATSDENEGNVSWYGEWNDLYLQKVIENNTWYVDGTIYAFLVNFEGTVTIIYPMHFPFNASSNRHEGDWPAIAVELDSQDPDNANIVSVRYPFHEEATVRTQPIIYSTTTAEGLFQKTFEDDGNGNPAFANKYFVEDNTHPVTFGGGRMDEWGFEGWGSHAQYPSPGIWTRVKGGKTIEEYVVENGSISNETLYFDFNNSQNIVLMRPRAYIVNNLRSDPDYNWAIFGGFWGEPFSYPSVDQGFFADLINLLIDVFVAYSFGILSFLPEIPGINVAPFSPYGGSLGW